MEQKSKAKENKKQKLKSKDELLQMMNKHLIQQQEFAEQLQQQANKYLKCSDETEDSEAKKKRNHYLNAYNQQVDAVSRTSATMIRIYNSSLENDDEGKEESNELVD